MCSAIVFAIRTAVAARQHTTPGLTDYMQATFAIGFVSLGHMMSLIVRTVLVNSTQPGGASTDSDSEAQTGTTPSRPGLVSSSAQKLGPVQQTPIVDDPRRRFWFRRWSDSILVLFFAALISAIVATAHFYGPNDTAANHRNEGLRSGPFSYIFSTRFNVPPGTRAPQLDWCSSFRWLAYFSGPEKTFLT
jgi:hypothetical protein